MGIIDFRVRPMVGGYCAMAENGTTDKFLSAFRCETPESVIHRSVELLVREMDDAGVDLAVVPARQSQSTFVSNEELIRMAEAYPGHFTVFPLYNPIEGDDSLQEIKDYILDGPCLGVSIEPGFGNQLRFDAEEYQKIYEFADAHGLPVLSTFSGSITSVLDMSLPERFHAMAKKYPNAKMIAGHGGWPWFRELCCMAFFSPNIYLLPDLYSMHCPGEQDIIKAANYMLRDKMLFGSSYPLLSIKEAVDHANSWLEFPDAKELFMYKNGYDILEAAKRNLKK